MRTKVTIYDRVLRLLKQEEKYRNSDDLLFLRILDDLGCIVFSQKVNEHFIPVSKFKTAPQYESVRRSRQKVQQEHPELVATDPHVRKNRGQKEATRGTWIYREAYNPAHDRVRL